MRFLFALTALGLASCSDGSERTEPPDSTAGSTSDMVAAQPASLAQCKTCHTFNQGGRDQIGPNLWGVYGRPAASDADFAYSTSMRNSGLVWDNVSLDTYLTNPQKMVPGGKMSFAGLKDAEERKAVIDYLATLKAETQPE